MVMGLSLFVSMQMQSLSWLTKIASSDPNNGLVMEWLLDWLKIILQKESPCFRQKIERASNGHAAVEC